MPSENGTETTRSDALSAADSLFGDSTANQPVAVTEKENGKNEAEQVSQGSQVAKDRAAGDKAGAPEDLKVVVSIKDGRATIGVQQPSSDPHVESVDAPDMCGLTQEVPAVIERARARWEEAQMFPDYVRPATSTGRRSRRGQGATRDTTEGESAQQQQTLRLF